MDLDALFRMPMTRRPKDGGLRPSACGHGVRFHAAGRSPDEGSRVRLSIDLLAGR